MKSNTKNNFINICKKYILMVIVGVLFMYVSQQIFVYGNEVIAKAINDIFSKKFFEFYYYLKYIAFFIFVGTLSTFISKFFLLNFSVCVISDYRKKIGNKIEKLEYKYFEKNNSASILTKMISDIDEVSKLFSEIIPNLFLHMTTVLSILIYVFKIDKKLLCIILICYPGLIYIANYVSKKLVPLAKSRRNRVDTLNEIAQDGIMGIEILRSYNLIEIFRNKLYAVIEEILANEKRRIKVSSASWVLQMLINWIPQIISAVFVLFEVLNGKILIGDMMAILILLGKLVDAMGEIPFSFNDIREINVSVERLNDLLNESEEQSGEKESLIETENIIVLDEIDFSYGERQIFNHLSINFKKGETTALVGESGSGKSTLFKILCGFYRKQSGEYLLNGLKYEEWNLMKARKLFSIVSQDVFLFPVSIAENIGFGKKEATKQEICMASKKANINSEIEKMKEQYNTIIGENGNKLSGGQKQRISIARAFLKNAPILLLDEPTSSIDIESENKIQKALTDISKSKTVIVIAHRLNTIKNADRIVVLSAGKIVGDGKHEELLKKCDTYKRLYEKELSEK